MRAITRSAQVHSTRALHNRTTNTNALTADDDRSQRRTLVSALNKWVRGTYLGTARGAPLSRARRTRSALPRLTPAGAGRTAAGPHGPARRACDARARRVHAVQTHGTRHTPCNRCVQRAAASRVLERGCAPAALRCAHPYLNPVPQRPSHAPANPRRRGPLLPWAVVADRGGRTVAMRCVGVQRWVCACGVCERTHAPR
jgi:hypothetical protein